MIDPFENLSNKLNLGYNDATSNSKVMVVQTNVPATTNGTIASTVVPYQNNVPTSISDDEEEDYQQVRQNFKNLSDLGMDAIEKLSTIANMSHEPRAFEVIAKLLQVTRENNEALYNLQQNVRTIRNVKQNEDNSIKIDKAVFVGSPAELLTQMKNNKNDATTTTNVTTSATDITVDPSSTD